MFHDRVKEAEDLFYGTQAGDKEYRDPDFTPSNAITTAHGSRQGSLDGLEGIRWVDSIDIAYPFSSLFGSTGIQATDIYQG